MLPWRGSLSAQPRALDPLGAGTIVCSNGRHASQVLGSTSQLDANEGLEVVFHGKTLNVSVSIPSIMWIVDRACTYGSHPLPIYCALRSDTARSPVQDCIFVLTGLLKFCGFLCLWFGMCVLLSVCVCVRMCLCVRLYVRSSIRVGGAVYSFSFCRRTLHPSLTARRGPER